MQLTNEKQKTCRDNENEWSWLWEDMRNNIGRDRITDNSALDDHFTCMISMSVIQ